MRKWKAGRTTAVLHFVAVLHGQDEVGFPSKFN
jgi:hypothetical protein